jgi:DNA-binding NarL/FixJ family response regulator
MTRILIVDGSRIGRNAVRSVVSANSNHRVIGEAASGQEAEALTAALAPEVVLLDLTLPDIGSFRLTRLLRKSHPTVKVILLSTFDNEEYRREAHLCGASGYLVKDEVASNLNETIHSVAATAYA